MSYTYMDGEHSGSSNRASFREGAAEGTLVIETAIGCGIHLYSDDVRRLQEYFDKNIKGVNEQ